MSKRIELIASLVKGSSAIDIGCDHGYLLIELQQKGFENLLAIEKNKGPLENCKNNLIECGLDQKINTLLSDGLKNLPIEQSKNYENIIIAGMGGDLITTIIQSDITKFENSYLILQPNNNEYKLRKFLNENNFEIKQEEIICESKKYYEIIVAKYSLNKIQKLSEQELMFGVKQNFSSDEFNQKWKNEEEYLVNLIKELKEKKIQINPKIKTKLQMIVNKRSEK